MQNLILESLGINFEFNKQKTKKLVCHFLFATSGFWPILLYFKFLIFTDPSGRARKFSPDPGDGEKLAGTFKKKSSPYLLRNSS